MNQCELFLLDIINYKRSLKQFIRLTANIYSKCSYPEHVIDTEMKKVKCTSRKGYEKIKSKGVLSVVTCHPSLNCLHNIIRDNTYFLKRNKEVKDILFPRPMMDRFDFGL